ncbi:hypothetical protein ACFOVU_10520 [Nocardiopsis sediminis]|uniref:Uncharacterized protein n=1 Tax=Nocardiopsis sediminis TaxID=1778267 RepID=A0ABV8FJN8_9ACTN
MVAIAVLGTVTLVGLAVLILLAVRMSTELHRLREQIARTRREVEPAYLRLRATQARGRADAR